jgi:two-component system, NtrC family, response regulator AtoC
MTTNHALIVEQAGDTRDLVTKVLHNWSIRVHVATTAREALIEFDQGVDLLFVADRLAGADYVALMRRLRRIDPRCPIMVLSDDDDVKRAVEALRLGATDYARKPISSEAIERFLQEAVGIKDLPSRSALSGKDTILGTSGAIRRARFSLKRATERRGVPVLLTGETGTGKSLAARVLHEEDPLAVGPYMTLACSALSSVDLDVELFGRASGDLGGERDTPGLLKRAQGGTLVIDDIDLLPYPLQGKLVAALEHGFYRPVDATSDEPLEVRSVACVECDLREAVRHQRFRADLYYRLAVFTVELPPLRDRPGDIELLARRFIVDLCRRQLRGPPSVGVDAIARLRSHSWPGNVRELRNVIEHAIVSSGGSRLGAEDFEIPPEPPPTGDAQLNLPPTGVDLRQLERRMVEQALRRAGGNLTRAASLLGLNRDQMRYRVTKYGLER